MAANIRGNKIDCQKKGILCYYFNQTIRVVREYESTNYISTAVKTVLNSFIVYRLEVGLQSTRSAGLSSARHAVIWPGHARKEVEEEAKPTKDSVDQPKKNMQQQVVNSDGQYASQHARKKVSQRVFFPPSSWVSLSLFVAILLPPPSSFLSFLYYAPTQFLESCFLQVPKSRSFFCNMLALSCKLV